MAQTERHRIVSRICTHPGCYERVTSGRCEAHSRPAWTKAQPTVRIRGWQLQRLREQLFAHEPLCRICRAAGVVTPATVRDHVVPLFEGGRDDESNVQALCQSCSDAKTQAESKRGQRR